MPVVCFSEKTFYFPPLSKADADGLLIVGGAVTPGRVLEAYPKGIFPWYNEDEPPMWWSPDPRFVLFPGEMHVSRSMQKVLHKDWFTFRLDTAFESVIDACATVPRAGQDGTWITPEMKTVYTELFRRGAAHSAEAWHEEKLVGGMYGVRIGNVFFGESMFSRESNASKYAFIKMVQHLEADGVQLLDCQVYTPHVATLGAKLISRDYFVYLLQQHCQA